MLIRAFISLSRAVNGFGGGCHSHRPRRYSALPLVYGAIASARERTWLVDQEVDRGKTRASLQHRFDLQLREVRHFFVIFGWVGRSGLAGRYIWAARSPSEYESSHIIHEINTCITWRYAHVRSSRMLSVFCCSFSSASVQLWIDRHPPHRTFATAGRQARRPTSCRRRACTSCSRRGDECVLGGKKEGHARERD